MKRVRLTSQLLAAPARATATARLAGAPRISTSTSSLPTLCRVSQVQSQTRHQSTAAAAASEYEEPPSYQPRDSTPLPSPPPSRARHSAKLAALHARLSLSPRVPVETLARALIDASADPHSRYNNANLAYIGSTLLNTYTSEFLITRYPRLPMAILFAAMKGYAGPDVLYQVARAWGVEPAAAPGEEVDPGYLQFDKLNPTAVMKRWGYVRAESAEIQRYKWRRGLSSRVLYDDAFGEMSSEQSSVSDKHGLLQKENEEANKQEQIKNLPKTAHANFVRAVVGSVFMHCGRESTKSFIKSHFLTRRLDLSNLFEFKTPTRELTRLCAREEFDPPVARLESETGRLSRTPVYVVGIYSGADKLGEGVGATLDEARISASINALKAWYLYSPGDVAVPSDTFTEDAAPWKPAYVDIGEIVS